MAAGPGARVESSVLMALGAAVRDREVLRFDYSPASPTGDGDGDRDGVQDPAPPRRA